MILLICFYLSPWVSPLPFDSLPTATTWLLWFSPLAGVKPLQTTAHLLLPTWEKQQLIIHHHLRRDNNYLYKLKNCSPWMHLCLYVIPRTCLLQHFLLFPFFTSFLKAQTKLWDIWDAIFLNTINTHPDALTNSNNKNLTYIRQIMRPLKAQQRLQRTGHGC